MSKNLELKQMTLDVGEILKRIKCDGTDEPIEVLVEEEQSLIVKKDGKLLDVLEVGRHIPFDVKKKLFGGYKRTGNEIVELILLSKGTSMQVDWGRPRACSIECFDLNGNTLDIFGELALSGKLEFCIGDPKKLYRTLLEGAVNSFTAEFIKERIREWLIVEIDSIVPKIIRKNKYAFVNFPELRKEIGEQVKIEVAKMLSEKYGLALKDLSVNMEYINEKEIKDFIKKLKSEEKEINIKQKEIELVESVKDKETYRTMLGTVTNENLIADIIKTNLENNIQIEKIKAEKELKIFEINNLKDFQKEELKSMLEAKKLEKEAAVEISSNNLKIILASKNSRKEEKKKTESEIKRERRIKIAKEIYTIIKKVVFKI